MRCSSLADVLGLGQLVTQCRGCASHWVNRSAHGDEAKANTDVDANADAQHHDDDASEAGGDSNDGDDDHHNHDDHDDDDDGVHFYDDDDTRKHDRCLTIPRAY